MKNAALIFTMLLLLGVTGCQTKDSEVTSSDEGSLEIEGSQN